MCRKIKKLFFLENISKKKTQPAIFITSSNKRENNNDSRDTSH